jgi:hypothetical protein
MPVAVCVYDEGGVAVSAFQAPWYAGNTCTKIMHCPSCGHDVTLRFLACGGRPISLIGCSEPDCTMACLADASVAEVEAASPESETARMHP